jgi:hypothetical protein
MIRRPLQEAERQWFDGPTSCEPLEAQPCRLFVPLHPLARLRSCPVSNPSAAWHWAVERRMLARCGNAQRSSLQQAQRHDRQLDRLDGESNLPVSAPLSPGRRVLDVMALRGTPMLRCGRNIKRDPPPPFHVPRPPHRPISLDSFAVLPSPGVRPVLRGTAVPSAAAWGTMMRGRALTSGYRAALRAVAGAW